MTWARLGLLLAVLAGALPAQLVDIEKSRFASNTWGRAGTCAPFELVLIAPPGSTIEVEIHWGNVVLASEAAVSEAGAVATLPVPVAEGVRVVASMGETRQEFAPRLPPRLASPSYTQPYVAVFAPDPVYARTVLPGEVGSVVADYYDLSKLFADWRLADGYDALVLFNPDDARLPAGAQRALAQFCSLGGVVFVAGSFRFGEDAADIPAPGDPVPTTMRGVALQRFEYGAGAIYSCEWQALARAKSSRAVIRDALLDHLWFGSSDLPGGPPPARGLPGNMPLLQPAPPDEAAPGAAFWALAALLLAGCGVLPLLAARLSPAQWLAPALVTALCAGVGGLALVQGGPEPAADTWTIALTGPRADGPVALRSFVAAQPGVETWRVNLRDEDATALPRPLAPVRGHAAWLVDAPLAAAPLRGRPEDLKLGRIAGINFRDFATAARQGSYDYARDQGRILDWWLENNAWRGRMATLAPCQPVPAPVPPGTAWRPQGAIAITTLRWEDRN